MKFVPKLISRQAILVIISHLILLVCFVDIVNSAKRQLKFAVIIDWESIAAKTGFLFAVHRFNNSSNNRFMLGPLVDLTDTSNSFVLASSTMYTAQPLYNCTRQDIMLNICTVWTGVDATCLCKFMGIGIFMLYGERQIETSSIIEAYSRKYHVPYISPSFADNVPRQLPTFQIHMRPSHTKALVDLIKQYEWRAFHYVYDSEEGLYRLQAILQALDDRYKYHVRMRRLSDVTAAHEDLRALDKLNKLENRTETFIVMDLSKEKHYPKVMQQVREVGMNKQGYHYILGTLEFLNLEMDRYQHGGVNITGFQLVNYSSDYVREFLKIWKQIDSDIWPLGGYDHIPLEAALAVDAVEVIQRTIVQLFTNYTSLYQLTFRRGEIYNYNKTKGVPCVDPPVPWMHGEALMRGMVSLHIPGVTGNIQFDEFGFRRDYKLDVYNVGLNNAPSKVGEWTTKHRMVYNNDTTTTMDKNLTSDSAYKVTSIMEEPFLMLREKPPPDGKPYVGNDIYEGFCADLAKQIASRIGIEYEIRLVKDQTYGVLVNNETDEWDGMVGELMRGEAQIAVAPLTINSERERVIDFSKPFMDIGISIMIKKPEIKKPGVFSFMKPFTWQLWMCIIFGYIAVGIGIFFVSRFSSAEWRRLPTDRKLAYNNFTLPNSLWFAMGSLMLQGSDDTCPRSASGRIIGGAWWFAVLITISSYTANLAAFLTIEKLLTPIESADDLVKQSEIAYGTLRSGSTNAFFKDSKVSTYKQMHMYMDTKPSVYVDNLNQGIQRVRESKGKYAFLLESVHNEYANNRKPCDTMKVGHNLNSNHYGIATTKHLPINTAITLAVLSLTEDGTLENMKKTWWIDKGECQFQTGHRESKKKSLSLSNVAGIYFILIAGLVLSIIIGVCEFIYFKSKPERVPSAMVYMMPGVDSDCTDDDVPEEVKLANHRSSNGPCSPVNGNAGKNNYFGYLTQYSPPRITVDVDSNTAV